MEKGKTAGRLQKDGDRTDIFAESPIVFADKSQCNANNIVYKIADEKTVPHNLFNVLDMKQKKAADKNQDEKKTYDTWQQGLLQIFKAVQENKPFILNVYR